MKTPFTPRALLIVGLVLMIAGAIDPLEGSIVILLGSVVVTLGAFLAHSDRRAVLAWSTTLVAVGVGLLFALSALGGVGGTSGRSMWWLLVLLPYPVGWLLGLIGAGRALRTTKRAA